VSGSQISPEQVEAQIAENLRFLADLASSPDLDPESRAAIAREHAALAARAASKEVRLAVVGEFSTGKSTLINALLGARILPEGFIPVTARATRIQYADRAYGEAVVDGRTERFDLSRLAAYTRDGQVASEVEAVRVFYPSPLLREGVVILDTPGDNVDNERHQAELEAAIAEANAVAFLIPADRAAQRTSMALLRRLTERIDKFYFVLTMADLLLEEDEDEDGLEETVDYVAGELAEIIGSRPVVYPVSARWVLEGRTLTLRDGTDAWGRLVDALTSGMRRDKAWIILGDLLRVQSEAMAGVRSLVQSRQRLTEAELAEIVGRTLDVAKVRARLQEQIAAFVDAEQQRILTNVRGRVAAAVADVKRRLQRVITEATSSSELERALTREAEQEVARVTRDLAEWVQHDVETAALAGGELVDSAFADSFAGLQEAAKHLFWRSPTLYLVLAVTALVGGLAGLYDVYVLQRPDLWGRALGFGALAGGLLGYGLYRLYLRWAYRPPSFRADEARLQSQMDTRALLSISGFTDEQAAGFGLLPGALAGLALGGPVGAVVVGMVGAFVASLFGKRLPEVKAEMRAKVAALTTALEQNLIAQQSAFVVRNLDTVRQILSGRVETHFNRYQDALDDMVNRQMAIARAVEDRKRRLDVMARNLERRLEALHTTRRLVKGGQAS